MRILIYALNFSPELSGAGKYTGELARALQRRGCDIRVVTTPPYYPAWRVGEGYSSWRYTRENDSGMEIIRCPLWVPRRPSGVLRMLHLLSFAASSFPAVLRESVSWSPDVVITIAPTIFGAPAALLAARAGGAAAFLHVQDFEIEAAFKLRLVKQGWLQRVALWMEESVLRGFDRVTTISERMLERLWQKGVDAERSALFPNGVNLREIRPLSDRGGWRDRQKIPRDAFLVLYSGSMGEKQGLELLLEAARMLSSDGRIFFVLCGEGSARERLLSASHGLNNVRFLPLQPASELNAMLNAADLHVLPQLAEAEDLVMPSKLGPILASGGATVATARPGTQIATAVTEAGGVVIPPGDASCLAAAIRDAAQNPARLEAAKRKAREYAESHLNDEAIYDGYFKLIRDSVSAAASKRQQQKSESAHVQKCVS